MLPLYYSYSAQAPKPEPSLRQRDPRLNKEIVCAKPVLGTLKLLSRWAYSPSHVTIGTTEEELWAADDLFLFGPSALGDVMVAYATLYRLRWVKYTKGNPTYELAQARDIVEQVYAPQDEFQKRRFDSTTIFMKELDKLDPALRADALAGKPLRFSALPPAMQTAFRGAVSALREDVQAGQRNKGLQGSEESPPFTEAKITLEDRTKPGSGLREFMINGTAGNFSFTYRWNDFDKEKTELASARPIAFSFEPLRDELFSRKKMIDSSEKLKEVVSVPEREWSLTALLVYLKESYKLNFLANNQKLDQEQVFSCEGLPLWQCLDRLSKAFGEREWELAPGNFIVVRSSDSPRRRKLETD